MYELRTRNKISCILLFVNYSPNSNSHRDIFPDIIVIPFIVVVTELYHADPKFKIVSNTFDEHNELNTNQSPKQSN